MIRQLRINLRQEESYVTVVFFLYYL